MSEVRAIAKRAQADDFSGDGSENPVTWNLLPLSSNSKSTDGWVRADSFSRLTIQVETDDQGNTFTVEARVHEDAQAFDLLAPTLVGASTVSRILEKENIEHIAEWRLLENGTAATSPHKAFAYHL